mmetsp:Transcript_101785/g.270804  ORF Transcript_101785/g.270804 Transcript_101785/m.270804 type:complete len:155 (-) Transcript_101785:224-688(-)
MADLSSLPPAGVHRRRVLEPRELLARSGSHAVAPPLHPRADTLRAAFPSDPDHSGNVLHLSRTPSQGQLATSRTREQQVAGQRPAGIGGFFQTAKTRSQFKQHAIVGQYSNELPSAIPGSTKVYHQLRAEGSTYMSHQPATSIVRKELEELGHF